MINVEDLAVVLKKRSKAEKEKSPQTEVSKHEKLLSGAEVSKARQRWNLLSYHLRRNHKKQASGVTNDVVASFIVFEAFFIPKLSNSGRWYHLKSPVGDVEFDVHIYSAVTMTPNVLIGFNNSGNIKVWLSEECLAYYLLKHKKLAQSKTILELGSGMVGLSGLTSVALGAAEVVLTDGNEKSVENIRRIVEINKLSNHVTCIVLPWNTAMPNKKFDAVLCADCLFFTEEHRVLLNCIHRHLKSGGIAYVMAPDRSGTARAFLNLVYEERERWESYQEIVDAIHYSCILIQDEVVEELERKGQKMEFDEEVIAQLAFAMCDTLCVTWPGELLLFAKHAKRSVVNVSDLRLLFRRNESVLSLIGDIAESSLLPARKRQTRKGACKKNSKIADNTEKMENENSKGVDAFPSENKDTLKLTDFWNQPSTSRRRPSQLFGMSSECISATTNEKVLCNSKSLQGKEIATKEKETVACCEQKDIIGSEEINNRSKRRNQGTKKWLQPIPHLDGFESNKKQELEFMENNEMLAENWTTVVANCETSSEIRTNETSENRTEFHIGSLPDRKSSSPAGTPPLNLVTRKQLMDKSLRNKSSAADDCFSSFKFESDDEDWDPNVPPLQSDVKNDENTLPSSSDSNGLFPAKYDSMNNNQDEHQDIGAEESDIDLDATIFDF
ncbi:unnamed protein product [Litomosoides sigmodontis]|uniref:Calmodulin-lysine N-methyltransferase n=1 Tax=Litomosoides sigmodontis TaxID=42156 RepID=A0A3P6SMF5_LITSI|nr:unnamed protein product [Litomosoides sigmodontis]